MKKKLICGMLIGTLVFSSAILTGCGSSNDVNQNTTNQKQNNSTESNSDNSSVDANDTNNSSTTPSDIDKSKTNTSNKNKDNSKDVSNDNKKKESSNSSENSKNINKDTTNNDKSAKTTSDAKDSNNTASKDSSNIDSPKNINNSNKNDTSNDSTNKAANNLTMQQLADKIADFEYDGNVKYITPVKPLGSGKDLTYEEDSSSNIFFCSDDKFDSKNLKYGTLVNLFGYNKESDSYSFRVTNYEFLKNGGTGTIDYGTVTSQGKINSANLN